MAPNKVFPLTMPLNNNISLKVEKSEESLLWHLRYGHMNYNGLRQLKKNNMVIGLPDIELLDQTCEGCIYGKMHDYLFLRLLGERNNHLN